MLSCTAEYFHSSTVEYMYKPMRLRAVKQVTYYREQGDVTINLGRQNIYNLGCLT